VEKNQWEKDAAVTKRGVTSIRDGANAHAERIGGGSDFSGNSGKSSS
jgi:hypothetical protein